MINVPGGQEITVNAADEGGEGQQSDWPGTLVYSPNPKHGQNRPGVGDEPTNPEPNAESAPEVKPGQHITYDPENKEIIVYREDNAGGYHGYVVAYDELNQQQKNTLYRSGLINLRGKPINQGS